MPYIDPLAREEINTFTRPAATCGELNYVITTLLLEYMDRTGGLSYTKLNELVGVLECAKQELYRRMAAPYEETKALLNGDVYPHG